MRTSVRVRRGLHPPRRPGRVLRVGRAARRSAPPRPARDRRRRRRARGELRGEGLRHPHRHGRSACAPAVPARRRRAAADVGVLGGEQGGVPRVRGRGTGRRGPLDRRGLPRRKRHGAERRLAGRDRRAPPTRRARASRPADHGRRRADEVPREGRERGCEAGRPARRAARRRARIPPSPAGGAAVGRWSGHRAQAARPRHHDRPAGGIPARVDPGVDARPGGGSSPPCARAQPRSPARAASAPATVDRLTACARPRAVVARIRRRRSRHARRPGRAPHADRGPCGTHRRAAAALRRLHAGDALVDAARSDGEHRADPVGGEDAVVGGIADDRAARSDARRDLRREPRRRGSAAARPPVRPARPRRARHRPRPRARPFGTGAITRAVLLGRSPGITMPMLPD